jgi:hypothetical protein
VRTKTLIKLTMMAAALSLTVAGSVAVTGSGANAATKIKPSAVAGTAYRQIRNAAYSQCVDAPAGALNVHLALADCSASVSTRNWVLVPSGQASTFFIVNQASGLCMEVNNGTSNPTAPVDEYTCDGLPSELWFWQGATLRHYGTDQCLDTVAGPGSELMQFTCGQAAPPSVQTWIVE